MFYFHKFLNSFKSLKANTPKFAEVFWWTVKHIVRKKWINFELDPKILSGYFCKYLYLLLFVHTISPKVLYENVWKSGKHWLHFGINPGTTTEKKVNSETAISKFKMFNVSTPFITINGIPCIWRVWFQNAINAIWKINVFN